MQASDGSMYGATEGGGTFSGGTIFKLTAAGTLTTLHSFAGYPSEGASPRGPLLQASDGQFYGATPWGGAYSSGTILKMSPKGVLTTLYSFCPVTGCEDGQIPNGGLLEGMDGNFYGMTMWGGSRNVGTIFEITRAGVRTTLYSFEDQFDGGDPIDGLLQDTNGTFYGTTSSGGICDFGVVFSFSTGLGPFVRTQPTSAKVGKPINILGTDLTGATSVTFNSTPTTFTVVSPSLITTTVPAGATTGTVQVVTPGGTLSSNVPFRVTQ